MLSKISKCIQKTPATNSAVAARCFSYNETKATNLSVNLSKE